MFVRRLLMIFAIFSVAGCASDRNAYYPQPQSDIAIPGDGVTIYAAGDIADCRNRQIEETGAIKTAALISAALANDKQAAVLTLGDNVYQAGLLSEYINCYEPTWGKFKARTYPSPGNHEYYTPAAVGYYDYFGVNAGPERRGYYSTDLGGWHILSLNSNLPAAAHQKQLVWLKSVLQQNSNARCTLAYWHHPVYSSGGHGNNSKMQDVWQVLVDAKVDVALVSHDHDYERFSPQDSNGQRDDAHGIRQFVVGTGGAKLTPFGERKANSEIRDNSTHGVLKMVLKATGYEWEFLPVPGGTFMDRGAGGCH